MDIGKVIQIIFFLFFLAYPPVHAVENQYGSLDGSIANILIDEGAIEFIDVQGKTHKLFLTQKTLIMHDNIILKSMDKSLKSFKAHVEYFRDEEGRMLGEWIDIRSKGPGKLPVKNVSRNDQDASDTEDESSGESMFAGEGDKPVLEDDSEIQADEEVTAIQDQGRSLIEMSPEEYEASVDEEAKKILKELGIE